MTAANSDARTGGILACYRGLMRGRRYQSKTVGLAAAVGIALALALLDLASYHVVLMNQMKSNSPPMDNRALANFSAGGTLADDMNILLSPAKEFDCGCPGKCNAGVLSETRSKGMKVSCLDRVTYLMTKYGDSPSKACAAAVKNGDCRPACDPTTCSIHEQNATQITPSTLRPPNVAIFYNIFTAPNRSNHTLDIINEQLQTWRSSSIAHSSTLYFAILGERISVPCKRNENCVELQNIDPSGQEEETLQKLYEYCVHHPQDNVVYMHTKGSFHDNLENTLLRRLLTKSALSDMCTTITQEDGCNVCSARFSPIPHWHTPGNMWVSECHHVNKLIPPKLFVEHVHKVVDQAKNAPSRISSDPAPSTVGDERFANEHWVHTHPDVKPCDIYTRNHWTWGYSNALFSQGPFLRANAPRFNRVIYDGKRQFPEWTGLEYRLFELKMLYNSHPPVDSWMWDFY